MFHVNNQLQFQSFLRATQFIANYKCFTEAFWFFSQTGPKLVDYRKIGYASVGLIIILAILILVQEEKLITNLF